MHAIRYVNLNFRAIMHFLKLRNLTKYILKQVVCTFVITSDKTFINMFVHFGHM